MKVVSERFIWRASACIVGVVEPAAVLEHASGLPVRRPPRVKTLTMR